MYSLISLILVLGVLIFVHELGHFLFAKFFGVRVLTFSLGFGPKLIKKKWGDTEYCISAFPLGGYVKMFGEQPDEEIAEKDQAVSFTHKTVWQRFTIVLAGPLFNLFFAVFVYWFMFNSMGLPGLVESPLIGKVNPESVAEKAGLKKGDLVLSVNSQEITLWTQLSEAIEESGGKQVELVVQRGDNTLQIKAVPVMEKIRNLFKEEVGQRYLLGIAPAEEYREGNFIETTKYAFRHTWALTHLTALGFVKLLQGAIPASEMSGPIGIAQLAGKQLREGWLELISFTAWLSINLGILNLLPVPVLDGGHLVFLSLEAVRRKPLGELAMIRAQQVGFSLLITLMIFVFYNDIARVVRQWVTP
jgi:regulator of sigma E protease